MQAFEKFLSGFGFDSKYVYAIIGVLIIIYAFRNLIDSSNAVFGYAFATAPVWLPVTLFYLFFEAWLDYVRKEFNLAQGRVTLEIKLPQEILKSPQAMELVLTQMHQSASPDNHIQTYYDGKNPPRYGLELVSRGGDVRFYINTPRKKFKNLIETQLYAQYPGIEVHELDIDYTAEIPWDPDTYAYFALHFGLKKADAYPIKTYVEYGLDKMPEEEEKIDPITTMIEMLGSVGPHEQVWIQILIDANREVGFKEGSLSKSPDWKDDARKQITEIIKGAAKRVGVEADDIGKNVNQFLTEAERDTIKAIERSIGKSAFNVAIRALYIGTKDSFNPGERIGSIITAWRSYDDLNRNAIGPKWRTDFDWNWWQDPRGTRVLQYKKECLERYKRRYYQNYGEGDKPKVMTTEELATIFHFPGKVATTPSLARIPSKRSEAPSNLPTG